MKKLDIVLLTSLATFFFFVVLIYSNIQGCERAVDSSRQISKNEIVSHVLIDQR